MATRGPLGRGKRERERARAEKQKQKIVRREEAKQRRNEVVPEIQTSIRISPASCPGRNRIRGWMISKNSLRKKKKRNSKGRDRRFSSIPRSLVRSGGLFQSSAGKMRHGTERGLRRVQSQSKILVRERREDVDRLMPRRVPPRAGVHAARSRAG